MTQIAAGLIGVVLGAAVSEALRFWQDHTRRRREVKGRLRLIRHELSRAAACLDLEGVTAEEIRSRVTNKTLTVAQWKACEAMLSEVLTQDAWLTLSNPYVGLELLIAEIDTADDQELLKVRGKILADIDAAADIVWAKDLPKRRGRR